MPRYDYRCQQCSAVQEQFFHIEGYQAEVACVCGGTASRFFSPTNIPFMDVDNTDRTEFYQDAGQHFSNRRERKQWLNDNGLAEIDPGDAKRSMDKLNEQRELKRDAARKEKVTA